MNVLDKFAQMRQRLARASRAQDERASRRGEGDVFGAEPDASVHVRLRKPKPRRSWRWAITRFVLIWGAVTAVAMVLLIAGAVAVYSYFATDPLKAGLSQNPAKLTILSEGGEVITEKGLRRTHVPYEEMPRHLIDAVLATEDRRFYWHFGFDPIGIFRAAIANYRAERIVQGGSTITQQLAKVLFLEPDRTYWRKIEEMLLALWLEYRLEKPQILELYLNRIYFGAGNYGVEAAAQHYFGKSVSEVGLYESAVLAGSDPRTVVFLPDPQPSARAATRQDRARPDAGDRSDHARAIRSRLARAASASGLSAIGKLRLRHRLGGQAGR